MNRWLVVSLVCFALAICAGIALAEPGDLQAAHAQQLIAPDAGGIETAITTVATAAAPFLPSPWNGIVVALMPLVGIITNFWWRWRNKDIAATDAKKANLILIQAIAYAEEKKSAAKKAGSPLSNATTLQEAVNYVTTFDNGKRQLFTGIGEIEKRLTSLLGRVEGVGATAEKIV